MLRNEPIMRKEKESSRLPYIAKARGGPSPHFIS